MLHDITTSARLNTTVLARSKAKKANRKVTFTPEGSNPHIPNSNFPFLIDTVVAMANERKQKKKWADAPRTPSKSKVPETTIIGSGSTWTETELDRYNVHCREGNVDVKTLIPEKWFTIQKPAKYGRGNILDNHVNGSARYIMFDFSRGRVNWQ
jgi:hypothetical protein